MGWIVHEKNGKFAMTLGWYTDREEPYSLRDWLVGKADAEYYQGCMGQSVAFRENVGQVYDAQRQTTLTIDTGDEAEWHRETERERIRKPRKGRDYDWRWERGEWRKYWL